MIVHACIETALAVFAESVGGHRQNRQAAAPFALANGAGGAQAIHDRHLHVHQDQVVILLIDHFNGFLTVDRKIGLQANATQ